MNRSPESRVWRASAARPPRFARSCLRLALLLAGIAGTLAWGPPAAAAQGTVTGEFYLVWRVAEDAREPVQVSYQLADDQGTVYDLELHPEAARAYGGALALNRRRVTVSGAMLALEPGHDGDRRMRVLSMAPAGPSASGEPAGAVQSGARAYATVLCRFADSLSVDSRPASYYQALLTGTAQNGLDHYWREVSDGRINLGGSTVVGWYNLPRTKAQYFPQGPGGNPDWDAMVRDCTGAADPSVNFAQFVGVNMQFNLYMPASWGGSWYLTADGVNRAMPMTWMASWAQHSVYAHEMGHSFGLPHSSGPYTATYDSRWDVMSNSYTSSQGGEWIGQHTVAYHKNILGWIPSSQRFVPPPGTQQTVVLNRSELPGTLTGYQMVEIPLAGGAFYTVEVRRKVGYDQNLPGEGVIIHHVVPTRADRAAQVVDADNNGDPNDAGAIWVPGETFRDLAADVAVSVEAASGTGFRVLVTRGSPPVVMQSDSVRRVGAVQRAYADTLRASGGLDSFSWSVTAGALPPGVALAAASGALTGTPNQVGTYRFTARAASGSTSASRQFRVEVMTAVVITSDSVRARARVGIPYGDTLRASGATGTFAWAVTGGAVPPGLALNPATGVISGSATAEGMHRFTVTATSATLTASLQLVTRVSRPLVVTSDTARPGATMGAAYRDTLRADGGIAAAVWRVTAGQLPPGVALDSVSGSLSGTAAAAGQYRFTATARAADESAVRAFVLAVAKPQLQPAAVVDQLLAGSGLTADQAHFLDLLGNRNGRVDVGDVRAWLAENNQINLSEHPVLEQIRGNAPRSAPEPPVVPRGEP